MATRSGLQTIIELVRHICKIWVRSQTLIRALIDASGLTSTEKTQVKDALQAVADACALLLTLENVLDI